MIRAMVVSALVASMGVPSMAQAPQVPLFASRHPTRAAAWQAVNDGVMGGVSDGRFRITERQTMEFYGTLSLENNGDSRLCVPGPGHSDCRLAIRSWPVCAATAGVPVESLHGRADEAFSYRQPARPAPESGSRCASRWTGSRQTSFGRVIPGAEPVDPRSVTSIGFLLAEKTPGPFALEVAWNQGAA